MIPCHLLDTAECTTDHTADNLAAGLEDIPARWQLSVNNLNGTTTDNDRNIVSALDNLDWPRVRCFAHTNHLGIQKEMEVPVFLRLTEF